MRLFKSALVSLLAVAAPLYSQTLHRLPAITSAMFADATSNTHYYGAVDLGSKGTKAALYSFVTDEDGKNPVIVFDKTINTKLVSSMQGGKFTKEGIADATNAVKQVVDAMKAEAIKQSLKVDTYYVVGSSGVAAAANKDELVASVKEATTLDMVFIDAAREGFFGLLSAVPRTRRPSSIYIDTGSGNTKIGCLVGDADLTNYKSIAIPFGSVSGRNEARKRNPQDYNAGISSVSADVSADYEKQSLDVPCLRNRQRIYWTGGAAWATATFTHPERALNGWVTITKKDLDTFLASLKSGSWSQEQPPLVLSKDIPEKRQAAIRAKARTEHDAVLNTFTSDDLISGVSIMESVLSSSNPSATVHFARNGNFIYGYALEMFKQDATTSGN